MEAMMETVDLKHEASKEAVALVKKGLYRRALITFEKTLCYKNEPQATSCYALCLAIVREEFDEALKMCAEAAKREFYNAEIYLNGGKIYLEKGRKDLAFKTFRRGLMVDKTHPEIITQIKKLGIRRNLTFKSLPRRHPVNKYAGLVVDRWDFLKRKKVF